MASINLAIPAENGHVFGVDEKQESARRWSGFVCPDCRFVFRVARDHDGSGIVCPSCRRLLRIPGPDEAVPPLLVEQMLDGGGASHDAAAGRNFDRGPLNVRRKRKRRNRHSDRPAWEQGGRMADRAGKRQTLVILAVGLLMLMAVVLAVVLMVSRSGDPENVVVVDDADTTGIPQRPLASNSPVDVSAPDPTASSPVSEGPQESGRGGNRILMDAHPVARAFLDADTVEALLKVVDRPEVVAGRIERYHPDGTIEPLGLGDYSQFSQVRQIGPYAMVPLRTRDFKVRMMTFRVYPDVLKVDWESWVGWSETSWDEFIGNRLEGTHTFRVNLAAVEYYNFDFADEQKWQSFRLGSPDEEHRLYGYVARDSPAHATLRSLLEQGSTQVTLELRFAENATTGDQVEIIRVVAENWIDPERLAEL